MNKMVIVLNRSTTKLLFISIILTDHFRHVGIHEDEVVVGQRARWLAVQNSRQGLDAIVADVAALDGALQQQHLENFTVGLGI